MLWRLIKKWIASKVRTVEQQPFDVEATLANLSPDPKLKGALLTSITHTGQSFDLRIDPDDRPVQECLEIASKLLASFQDTNKKALSIASANLLESYNDNWREYSKMEADGQYKDVSNPKLGPADFEAIIKISALNVTGQMVEFFYSDNGLFAGHSIVVTSFDGIDFSDTNAEIFG